MTENPMTAPTVEGAIAIETARGDEYRAEIWRAGYAAALADVAERIEAGGKAWSPVANDIRSMPTPDWHIAMHGPIPEDRS